MGAAGLILPCPEAASNRSILLLPSGHVHRQYVNTAILLVILVSTSLLTSVVSQNGFISIDCGGTGGRDPDTGLDWVADGAYLHSAQQLRAEGIAMPASTDDLNDNSLKQLSDYHRKVGSTAMFFVPGIQSRPKYCYHLTVPTATVNSTDYLIRARFPALSSSTWELTNFSQQLHMGTYDNQFDFTVDSTYVAKIDTWTRTDIQYQNVEMVFTPSDENIYICLVPVKRNSSLVYISSLELRPVDGSLYSRRSGVRSRPEGLTRLRSTYLKNLYRINFGGNDTSPPVRYPDDVYDRIWAPDTAVSKSGSIKNVELNSTGIPRSGHGLSSYELQTDVHVPSKVLDTAWEGTNLSSEITFDLSLVERPDGVVFSFYLNMMFLDIDPGHGNSDERRYVDIYVQDLDSVYDNGSNLTLWTTPNQQILDSSTLTLSNYQQAFPSNLGPRFHIRPSHNSTLPAIVNALELYAELEAKTSKIGKGEALLMRNFEKFVNEVDIDTAGDPCSPLAWEWVSCTEDIGPPEIETINLRSKGLTGELDTLDREKQQFEYLVYLRSLDLSNNSFNGSIPRWVARLKSLTSLNLADNQFSGDLPQFMSLSSVEDLSFANNALTGNLGDLVSALNIGPGSCSYLDLSHNHFTDSTYSLRRMIRELQSLDSLDLSFNKIRGILDEDMFENSDLKTLNLRDNSIHGTVPSNIWRKSSMLGNVSLMDNNFTELNLTLWSQRVLEARSFSTCPQHVVLNRNQIDTVDFGGPSEDAFEVLQPYHKSGDVDGLPVECYIMLGENPWCDKVDKAHRTLVRRYLCRSSVWEDFWSPQYNKSVSTKKLIMIGVGSGLLIVLMACILFFFSWRMLKRMHELRQIQEALAKDDVRPPFFKYEDLKTATDNFSQQNELGKGGYGAVYKALMGDGSIVAVKRLFPTEQNIADFLKEVVLITRIKHRHLVQLKGCCVRDKHRMLVYEYAENKNLAYALWGSGDDKPQKLTWAQRLNICVGIARGLAYLHEELQPKIIHRDIKPQNILLDKDLNPKIADFGLARYVNYNDVTQRCTLGSLAGTMGYFSPEYAMAGVFSEKLDVYSYGVLVLEIVSGRRCINHSLPEDEVYLPTWAVNLYKDDKLLDMAERDLLGTTPGEDIVLVLKTALSCLQEEPSRRPAMSEVVNILMRNSEPRIDLHFVTEPKLNARQLLYDDLRDHEDSKGNVNVGAAFRYSSSPIPQGLMEFHGKNCRSTVDKKIWIESAHAQSCIF